MINLTIFNNNLFKAGTELFNQLGIRLNSNTTSSLSAKELLKDHYKDKGIFNAIDEAYFMGLVDDSVFDGNTSLLNKEKISLKEAEDRLTAEYNGLMVFAVRLKDSYSPTRSEIADLTRAFNRASKSVPVVLLLKYGGLLSFTASERIKYKQAWREGEKIGKISLLKDIKVAAPHTGHLKILDDLKVAPAVTDFNALYKQWQEVFNVQLLNKKFYQELFYWYLWAVKKVKFPQIRPEEDLIPDDAHQSESVIRLLTRLLFCWFMKEKQELIPELLFDKSEVKNILHNFSPEKEKSSVFYRAILQNLFFATLSVPIKNRKYICESFQGKNKDYGNQYVYRYQDEFVNAKENLKLFKDIPFLNGGLFECLDEVPENDNETEIRIDGFSSKEKKQAFVPDYLFWDRHRGIDLSEELDNTRKKNETAYGIIDILNSYKFTIEENTPLEEEIALDPELLGKVFESLLAYYNPETKANARKQTGSFYTPREIVNYMVDESLIAAFQQKLSDAGITENIEQRLRGLISYNETENPFTEKETSVLIQALENLKVLDPACGSGAFPMGILHKLVWILQKVDPENKKWFESIIKRLPDYAQSEMRKKLEGENWDYLRKLGIIQQSVYGVDIQPIAIQIAKLRFFISLLVDQDIKGNVENNFGLQPLPNLDFKLVSANTLIGAPEQSQQSEGKSLFGQDEFFDAFNKLTGQYFGTYEPAEKKKLTKKIEKLVCGKVREKVDEIKSLSTHTDERFSKRLAEKNKAAIEQKKRDAKLWESYNNLFKHESVGFFEIKYFFPEVKEGFDVVIGNPPYGAEMDAQILQQIVSSYSYYDRQKNSASFFIEVASRLVKKNAIVTYIVPKSLSFSEGWNKTRQLISATNTLHIIIDASKAFENVLLEAIIISFINKKSSNYFFSCGESWANEVTVTGSSNNDLIKELDVLPVYVTREKLQMLRKISQSSVLLSSISNTFRGLPLQSKVSKSGDFILRGKNIGKYRIYREIDKISLSSEFLQSKKVKEIMQRKIVSQNIVAHVLNPYDRVIIMAALDTEGELTLDTVMNTVMNSDKYSYEYILALLNSQLASWFYYWFVYNRAVRTMHFDKYYIGKLPVKNITSKQQQPFITLVDQILAAKKQPPSSPFSKGEFKEVEPFDKGESHTPQSPLDRGEHADELPSIKRGQGVCNNEADTSALEKQIDEMVYDLYGLTPEEIAIVEGKG